MRVRRCEKWAFLILGWVLLVSCRSTTPALGPTVTSPPTATPTPEPLEFDGEQAYQHVVAQCDFGFRPTGSEAWQATGDYIIAALQSHGWMVETQEFPYHDVTVRNIIGKAGQGSPVIIGAHYDTRLRADQDRTDPTAAVLGANDGASGVAVLLELARVLDRDKLSHEVWLAFFDAEDNGDLDGWEWIVGSTYMAGNLTVRPEFVIVVDMVGDAEQQIYKERNSDAALQDRLWAIAANLGYGDFFIPEYKWAMFDDHTPFAARGIVAVDIIDFDYPYWHTAQDTPDKVSAASLEHVGRVVEVLLEGE